MAELELNLELLSKEALKDLQKFAKSFEKFASQIEKKAVIEPKVKVDFSKQFRKASSQLGKFVDDSKNQFKSLGDSIFSTRTLLVGLAGALAVNEIIGGIQAVTEKANIQEDAVKRLNTALKLSGDFSKESSRDLQTFASQLQQTTSIGDETTLGLLALAKSFNVTNEEAKELVTAAANLSAQTGIELESAVKNLGKSLSGLSGELGESVAGIRDLTAEELKAGAAIDLVNNRFAGAAAAAAQTFSGRIRGVQGAFGDLQEEIGSLITQNPAVLQAITELKGVFETLQGFISDNEDEITKFINNAIVGIVDNIPDAVQAIGSLAGAGVEIAKAFNRVDGVVSSVLLNIIRAGDDLSDAFKVLINPINSLVAGFAAIKRLALEKKLADIGDESTKTSEILKNIGERLGTNSEGYKRALENANNRTQKFREEISALNAEIARLDKIQEISAKEITIDAKLTEDVLQARVDAAIDAEVKLEGFQEKIEKGTEKLVSGAQEIADRVGEAGKKPKQDLEEGGENAAKSLDNGSKKFTDQIETAAIAFGNQVAGIVASGLGAQRAANEAEVALAEEKAEYEKTGLKDIKSEIANAANEAGRIRRELANGGQNLEVLNPEKAKKLRQELVNAEKDRLTAQQKLNDKELEFKKKQLEIDRQREASSEQAAAGLVSAFGAGIIDTIVPGLGGALGPIFNELALGGAEAATEFVNGLVEALPTIVDNLVEATPAIILALAEQADVIALALGRAMPQVAFALAAESPQIAAALIDSVINIGVGAFAALGVAFKEEVLDPLTEFNLAETIAKGLDQGIAGIKSLLTEWEQRINDFFDGLDKLLPKNDQFSGLSNKSGVSATDVLLAPILGAAAFAATGGVVGGVGKGDSKAFALEPGELIVSNPLVRQLEGFLANQGAGTGSQDQGDQIVLLAQILNALQQPMQVSTNLELNGDTLADVILSLSRSNARLTA